MAGGRGRGPPGPCKQIVDERGLAVDQSAVVGDGKDHGALVSVACDGLRAAGLSRFDEFGEARFGVVNGPAHGILTRIIVRIRNYSQNFLLVWQTQIVRSTGRDLSCS